MQKIVEVKASGGVYPVLCGERSGDMLAHVWQPGWKQAAVVGDANTDELFGAALVSTLEQRCESVLRLQFPAGEAHKTRKTKGELEDRLLEAGFDRNCCVVGVGGGIALDVAGYVAATYLRGVAHVNVATSLLAQVDAAVGGKTGVNTRYGKNLIGAFHQPRAVIIDVAALGSLPEAELRNGWAEAVKHAVLGDAALFAAIERWAADGSGAIPPQEIVSRCVQIKAEVVEKDERESAYRQVLNFGHTVAHALEAASDHAIAHGEAVALGMVVEAHLAVELCGFPASEVGRLVGLLGRLGLPTRPPLPFSGGQPYLGHDKKTRGGTVHCSLPEGIGRMFANDGAWAVPVSHEALERAWTAAQRDVAVTSEDSPTGDG